MKDVAFCTDLFSSPKTRFFSERALSALCWARGACVAPERQARQRRAGINSPERQAGIARRNQTCWPPLMWISAPVT